MSTITKMGLFPFVNTLGAILAPVFGIMIVDYYIIKKEKLDDYAHKYNNVIKEIKIIWEVIK